MMPFAPLHYSGDDPGMSRPRSFNSFVSRSCALLGILLLVAHVALLLHEAAPAHSEEEPACIVCLTWDRNDTSAFDAGVAAALRGCDGRDGAATSPGVVIRPVLLLAARGPPSRA